MSLDLVLLWVCFFKNKQSHKRPLTCCVSLYPLQTQRPEHLYRDRGHRAPEVGPGPVSPSSVGYLFLLHLEGSQVHWESECWGVDTSCSYCVAWMLFGLYFFTPTNQWQKTLLLRENPHAWKAVNLVDLKTQASAVLGVNLLARLTVGCKQMTAAP